MYTCKHCHAEITNKPARARNMWRVVCQQCGDSLSLAGPPRKQKDPEGFWQNSQAIAKRVMDRIRNVFSAKS